MYERKLEDLTDYQILEIYQIKNVDLEFNVAIQRVTSLAALVPVGEDGVLKMFDSAIAKRDENAMKKVKFLKRLQEL